MARFDASRPSSLLERVRYSVSHPGAVFTAWNNQRRTRDTLSQFSNRQLDDLGLSRGDIDRIAGSGRPF